MLEPSRGCSPTRRPVHPGPVKPVAEPASASASAAAPAAVQPPVSLGGSTSSAEESEEFSSEEDLEPLPPAGNGPAAAVTAAAARQACCNQDSSSEEACSSEEHAQPQLQATAHSSRPTGSGLQPGGEQPQGSVQSSDESSGSEAAAVQASTPAGQQQGAPRGTPSRSARRKARKRQLKRQGVLPYGRRCSHRLELRPPAAPRPPAEAVRFGVRTAPSSFASAAHHRPQGGCADTGRAAGQQPRCKSSLGWASAAPGRHSQQARRRPVRSLTSALTTKASRCRLARTLCWRRPSR